MTIQSTKQLVPTEFPAAKLYFDDLEEIVSLLSGVLESHKLREEQQTRFTFTCAGRQCDSLDEVPKVLKWNREFTLEIKRGDWLECRLLCNPWFTTLWNTSGLTEEEAWATYRRLSPIFERRKRGLAVIQSAPFWVWVILILLGPWLLHPITHSFEPKITYKTAEQLEGLLGVIYAVAFIGARFRNTTLSPKRSYESSFSRTLFTEKIIPGIVIAILSVLGTLFTQYLIHKLCPQH